MQKEKEGTLKTGIRKGDLILIGIIHVFIGAAGGFVAWTLFNLPTEIKSIVSLIFAVFFVIVATLSIFLGIIRLYRAYKA